MIDLVEADKVEITLDGKGKLWVNINDVCVLRIGKCKQVIMDDPLRGLEEVWGTE